MGDNVADLQMVYKTRDLNVFYTSYFLFGFRPKHFFRPKQPLSPEINYFGGKYLAKMLAETKYFGREAVSVSLSGEACTIH